MVEPTRWAEGGEGLDPEIGRLLRSAPRSQPMTTREYARSWRRFQSVVAAAPAVSVLLWVKVGLAALGVIALGTAAVYGVRLSEQPTHSVSPPSASPASAPPAPEPGDSLEVGRRESDADPGDSGAAPDAASVTKARETKVNAMGSTLPAQGDSLELELALIERARAQVRSDPAHAERLLRDHAARFPRGTLAMERELVMIEVLLHSGRRAEARRNAELLLRRSKGSLYEARLSNLVRETQ